jgi:hypothetical protein
MLSTIGLDLAMLIFQAHGADQSGAVIFLERSLPPARHSCAPQAQRPVAENGEGTQPRGASAPLWALWRRRLCRRGGSTGARSWRESRRPPWRAGRWSAHPRSS